MVVSIVIQACLVNFIDHITKMVPVATLTVIEEGRQIRLNAVNRISVVVIELYSEQ